jgi:hypothetical protein
MAGMPLRWSFLSLTKEALPRTWYIHGSFKPCQKNRESPQVALSIIRVHLLTLLLRLRVRGVTPYL